jgi:hypothetical protein
MTSQDKLFFNIVNGPSKFDLMLSLFDGNKTPRRTVDFHLEGVKTRIQVAITEIQQEDGSGESWNFEGHTQNPFMHFQVCGYFSTSGRTGTLNFLPEVYSEWIHEEQRFRQIITPAAQKLAEEFADKLRGK